MTDVIAINIFYAANSAQRALRKTFMRIKLLLLTGAALLLSACAVQQVQLGASREEVISRYGKPSATVVMPSGTTRLQYSLQPAGQSAVMVDLDAAGRVVAAGEALNPAGFAQVEIGKWTRADAERAFGPPAWVDRVYSWPGDILNYRWRDTNSDMFFWVYLDDKGVVQRIGQGIEHRNDSILDN
jgi:hypothetical protein